MFAPLGPSNPFQPYPEINFIPSGSCPEIDLGALPFDAIQAERRR